MEKIKITVKTKTLLADTITPVSIYLKVRDKFSNPILLESSDYRGSVNSSSFICFQPLADFMVEKYNIIEQFPGDVKVETTIDKNVSVPAKMQAFINAFQFNAIEPAISNINGLFGYASYDAVKYFENISINAKVKEAYYVPEIKYSFFKYIIAVNHFKNELTIIENLFGDEKSKIEEIETLLNNKNFATYPFVPFATEQSNLTDEKYMEMVAKGKEHCFRGDVFQIVLSRQFSQKFTGDDFNVYRALRSVNPSPYLFYFDYGNYKIFGSSPESQLTIKNGKAYINPIAGTFKRTGDDEADKILAEKLLKDPKENAEHVMLVDLARNDLSRNSKNVKVEVYSEVQYYSHVLHLVSTVSGELEKETNTCKVMADTFPAGTLSGAPKYKAMELIDKYENQNRGYYGGCIGCIGFNGDFNQAIMIRSFLSKNNTLFYQAGAGIVSESKEINELNEVNNKLAALKKAIDIAGIM
ncbi:MAG: anthranilate synthase component I family protein [Bacteroidales bacterium]|nr:anthranilate synthase component I family protein [Bacteroidales bacterium]